MLINLRGGSINVVRHTLGSRLFMSSSVIAQIKARSIIYEKNGEPSHIVRGYQWDLPEPTKGEVRLKVGLASINPAGGC